VAGTSVRNHADIRTIKHTLTWLSDRNISDLILIFSCEAWWQRNIFPTLFFFGLKITYIFT
jgi:hypothetical protein